MNPRVSVIIPVYNAEKYLRECIESVLDQSYREFELLLVDDGSKDASGMICAEYAKKDARVCYLSKENGGVSSARNFGMAHASGEFLAFVDADDRIRRDMLSLLLSGQDAELSVCGFETFGEDVESKQFFCPVYSGEMNGFARRISEYIAPPFLLSPCMKLFRRELIFKFSLQFLEEISYGEDAMFVFSYLMHCKTVHAVSKIGYSYRKHGTDSLSGKFFPEIIDLNHQINVMLGDLLAHERIPERKEILAERFSEWFLSYVKALISSDLSFSEKQKLYYEKYRTYRDEFAKPKRMAHQIVKLAGECKLFYPLLYLFQGRG